MGCASSVDQTAGHGEGGPRSGTLMKKYSNRSVASGKKVYEEVSVAESAPRSQWEAGYRLDEDATGPFNTLEDYRGFTITMSTNASRNKADVVCRWADAALDERAKEGGEFFNPQNPCVWPKDLLATYSAYFSDQFTDPINGPNTNRKRKQDSRDAEKEGAAAVKEGGHGAADAPHSADQTHGQQRQTDLVHDARAKERERIAAI